MRWKTVALAIAMFGCSGTDSIDAAVDARGEATNEANEVGRRPVESQPDAPEDAGAEAAADAGSEAAPDAMPDAKCYLDDGGACEGMICCSGGTTLMYACALSCEPASSSGKFYCKVTTKENCSAASKACVDGACK
jgi:hypothetical protein